MKSDEELGRDVESELQWDPNIDAADIAVAVKDGVVTLTGFVRNFNEKWEAEEAAMRVAGTLGVANALEVNLPAISQRPDPEIATDVVNALLYLLSDDADKIRAVVKDGWVTLEGEVERETVKRRAAIAATRVRGVRELINTIKVGTRTTPLELGQRIEEALKRSALVDAGDIVVDVYGGEVLLKGTVRSWAARREAEEVAWRAPGVTRVENRIAIQN